MALYFEEGKYRARITGQLLAEGKTKDDGTETAPSVQITFNVIGYYDQNELIAQHNQYDRTVYLPLTEGTVGTDPDKPGWVLQTLQALGFNAPTFAVLDPECEGHLSFVDVEIDVLCRHETFEGKEREKWSILRDGGTKPQAKPLEKKAVRALDAKFGKLLKSLAKQPRVEPKRASRPQPTPTAQPVGPEEDKIPF